MLTTDTILDAGAPPLVAILRGLRPEEAEDVGQALVEAGIRLIEVPLNSPDPFDSITRLQVKFGYQALIGAGTVLDIESVERLAETGGRLMVTPNVNVPVIARAVELGLEVMPGFMTPSEAFAAIGAGAVRLKLFPAATLGRAHLGAVREVLPRHVRLWAVGGVSAANTAEWLAGGAEGLGVGGAIYKPGDTADVVAGKARAFVDAWRSRG